MFWLDVLSRQVHDLLCNPYWLNQQYRLIVRGAPHAHAPYILKVWEQDYRGSLCLHEQPTNRISLKKNRPRCYAKSPTAWDAFQPIPGLISCTEVTGRWRLLYLLHKMLASVRTAIVDMCQAMHVWQVVSLSWFYSLLLQHNMIIECDTMWWYSLSLSLSLSLRFKLYCGVWSQWQWSGQSCDIYMAKRPPCTLSCRDKWCWN